MPEVDLGRYGRVRIFSEYDEPMTGDPATDEAIRRGTAETILSLGSSYAAEPFAGLNALAQPNTYGAADATREAMTYQPRGEVARNTLQSIGEKMEPVGNWLAENVREPAEKGLRKLGPAGGVIYGMGAGAVELPGRRLPGTKLPEVKGVEVPKTRKMFASEFSGKLPGKRNVEEFNRNLAEARAQMTKKNAAQVDAVLPEGFKGNLYQNADQTVGFALSDRGYVSHLWKAPNANVSGVMGAALTKARAAGAKNLDAFDTFLAKSYMKRGAVETGRSPWDPEFATPEIIAALGDKKPDYVSMDIGGVIPERKHSNVLGPRPQEALPRQATPRGEPQLITESFKGGKVDRLNRIVQEGIRQGGERWYYLAGMLDEFINELGPKLGVERFDEFMNLNAAVSPRSDVAMQIKRASVLYQRQRQGKSIKNLSADMFPPGYGHLATTTAHRPAVNRIVETGRVGDPKVQPKISSYAADLQGNYQPLTVDTHNQLIVTGRNTSPTGAQYVHSEARQGDLAARMELQPGEWQSALWVGGGDITGVRDVRNMTPQMNRRIAATAEVLNIPEEEALVRFIHGDTKFYALMGAVVGAGLIKAASDEETTARNALNES
jgi:hypothetical protein